MLTAKSQLESGCDNPSSPLLLLLGPNCNPVIPLNARTLTASDTTRRSKVSWCPLKLALQQSFRNLGFTITTAITIPKTFLVKSILTFANQVGSCQMSVPPYEVIYRSFIWPKGPKQSQCFTKETLLLGLIVRPLRAEPKPEIHTYLHASQLIRILENLCRPAYAGSLARQAVS